MSARDGWTRLYLVRWPDGAATVLSASSLEHAADLIDEVDNASECEVSPFEGELWLTFRPAADPIAGPLALDHRPTLEIDSQAAIVADAFPVLGRVLDASTAETAEGDHLDVPVDADGWSAAAAMERERILAPSPEWKAAVERWWEALGAAPDSEDS